jgi:uncharacterized protein (DUF1330 family)
MNINENVVVIWTESEPASDGLSALARDHGGQLLAAGPVDGASELDARPAPAGLVIARFGAAEAARSWFGAITDGVDGVAMLLGGATDPVWWPVEIDDQRPNWSRTADFPDDRLGQFVSVWVGEINDLAQFFDYSVHYRWTVEHGGGVVLSAGSSPRMEVLLGEPAPLAMALMAWPEDGEARRKCEGSQYRPYRRQRHGASDEQRQRTCAPDLMTKSHKTGAVVYSRSSFSRWIEQPLGM